MDVTILIIMIVLFLFNTLILVWRRGVIWSIAEVFIPVVIWYEGADLIIVITMLFIAAASLVAAFRVRE